MTRTELKKEIKEFIGDSVTYDEMIHKFSIYITNNYKRRKQSIDSTKKKSKRQNLK